MDRVAGKVCLITGGARGQGRAEAVRLAAEGADIVLIDLCGAPAATTYPSATEADLDETAQAVADLGQRVIKIVGDVRDLAAMERAVAQTIESFGRLDVVVANAGIVMTGRLWEISPQHWQDIVDVNLTGVFNTLRASVPEMIKAGNGGSIIATSSVAGLKALPRRAPYSAAKHGVVGLVKAAAIELGEYDIRVNSVHPWAVETQMANSDLTEGQQSEDDRVNPASWGQVILNPSISAPEDIANAVLFLASDESRTITGIQLAVDHGATIV